MTKVPIQATPQIAVNPAPKNYQSTNVPSGAFDNGSSGFIQAGTDLLKIGDMAGAIALENAREDNDAEVKELDMKVAQAINLVTVGDTANDLPGYYASQNKDAIDGYVGAEDALRGGVEEVVATSSNPLVRRKVEQMAAVRMHGATTKMGTHLNTQRESYLTGVSKARIAQFHNDAVAAYNDPKIIAQSLSGISGEVADEAERTGLSKEEREVMELVSRSATVKGAFDAAIADEDVASAGALLKNHGAKVDPAIRAEMAEDLRKETNAKKVQTAVAAAQAAYPNDLPAQKKYIDDLFDGKIQDDAFTALRQATSDYREELRFDQGQEDRDERKTRRGVTEPRSDLLFEQGQTDRVAREEQRVKTDARTQANHEHTVKTRAEKEARDKAAAVANDYLFEGGTVAGFRKEHPDEWALLKLREREQLQTAQKNIAEGKLFPDVSTPGVLHSVRMADPEDRAKILLPNLRKDLAKGDYDKASAYIASAQAEIKATEESRVFYNEGKTILRDYASSLLDLGSSKQNDRQRMQWRVANTEMTAFITDKTRDGGKPTRAEIEAEATRILLEVTSDPWLGTIFGIGFEERNAFTGLAAEISTMSKEQRDVAEVPFKKIPVSIKDQILETAKAYGLTTIRPDLMQQLAGAKAMKDRARVERLLEAAEAAKNAR